MEIFLAGRATVTFKGVAVPVEELLVETSRHWLKRNLHALDAERQVKLHAMIRPGSADLVDLYLRQQKTGVALANDTSCGVGYAPLDELEQLVYAVERHLNSATTKAAHPEIGEDIKVMGVRLGEAIKLTVACAFVDRHIKNMDDYVTKKAQVVSMVSQQAQQLTSKSVAVEINTADGDNKDSIYFTVTGTSAEAGDDGEVGRGNRVNGLITPYRPMNMEAAAGKNPVTHVGKLYNIVAQHLAQTIVQTLPAVQEAQCYLVSRIGHPINEPQVVDLKVQLQAGVTIHEVQAQIQEIADEHLSKMGNIQEQLLAGAIKVY
jgi:S-adenosylmethionine synthetase